METPKNQQAVLVFTDLVDSVKLQQHIGAVQYSRLKAWHDRAFRAALEMSPGALIVESTGDGFYVRFLTCSAAVRTCLRFQFELSKAQLKGQAVKARIGIHCGEVFHDASVVDQLLGMAPNITARIMSLAMPGQILMTAPVYHDAIQYVRTHPPVEYPTEVPTLRWINHGQYLLKGYAFPFPVFEVGAVGVAPLCTPPSSEKARRVRYEGTAKNDAKENKQPADPPQRFATFAIMAAALAVLLVMGTLASLLWVPEENIAQLTDAAKASLVPNAVTASADVEKKRTSNGVVTQPADASVTALRKVEAQQEPATREDSRATPQNMPDDEQEVKDDELADSSKVDQAKIEPASPRSLSNVVAEKEAPTSPQPTAVQDSSGTNPAFTYENTFGSSTFRVPRMVKKGEVEDPVIRNDPPLPSPESRPANPGQSSSGQSSSGQFSVSRKTNGQIVEEYARPNTQALTPERTSRANQPRSTPPEPSVRPAPRQDQAIAWGKWKFQVKKVDRGVEITTIDSGKQLEVGDVITGAGIWDTLMEKPIPLKNVGTRNKEPILAEALSTFLRDNQELGKNEALYFMVDGAKGRIVLEK